KRMLGTPIYMSPEQARRESPDERSDIYCLGSTLFHLLTLRFPCWSDDLDEFWDNKCKGVYQQASDAERKLIPHALLSITEKAMQPNPEDRYPSVEAMVLDLEAFLQGQAVSAHHDSVGEMIKRIYKKEPRVIYAAILGLLLIIGSIGWLYYEKTLENTRWIQAYNEDFSNSSSNKVFNQWQGTLLPGWVLRNKKVLDNNEEFMHYFAVQDGSLQFIKSYNHLGCINLTYKKHIPGNMRISWDYTAEHDGYNLNCFVGGKNRQESYMFHVGGHGISNDVSLTKGTLNLAKTILTTDLKESQNYHFQMLKTDVFVSLSIDGKEVIRYIDPDILVGNKHQYFGFDFMHETTVIDNIHIEYQPLPQKIQPITVAHHYFSNGLYSEALDHYRKIRNAYSDTQMAPIALYRIGRSCAELGDHDEARLRYKQFLQAYQDHHLTDHVALQYANILSNTRNWPELKNTIQKYGLATKSLDIRQSLMVSIENQLISTLHDPKVNKTNSQTINSFDPHGRTLKSLRQDMQTSLDLQQTYLQLLDLPFDEDTSALTAAINILCGIYLQNSQILYKLAGEKSGFHFRDLLKHGHITEAKTLYPQNAITTFDHLQDYPQLLQLLNEDPQSFKDYSPSINQYGNKQHPSYLPFIKALSRAFPDSRSHQAFELLADNKIGQVITDYSDQNTAYINALEMLGKHQAIVDHFEKHGNIFNLQWLLIRVYFKMGKDELALNIGTRNSVLTSSYTPFARALKAVQEYLNGKQEAFAYFDNNELFHYHQHAIIQRYQSFLKLRYGHSPAEVIADYRSLLARNIANQATLSNNFISYVIGDIDDQTYLDSTTMNHFDLPSIPSLAKAMRFDLQGKKKEAIKYYTIASGLLEYESQIIIAWRLKELQK
ncbi:MAG: hypothetical protein HRU15_15700, partial [Planctomycetes bacterium]|nr:hypothetical protein [Planctomycetota bacterium]